MYLLRKLFTLVIILMFFGSLMSINVLSDELDPGCDNNPCASGCPDAGTSVCLLQEPVDKCAGKNCEYGCNSNTGECNSAPAGGGPSTGTPGGGPVSPVKPLKGGASDVIGGVNVKSNGAEIQFGDEGSSIDKSKPYVEVRKTPDGRTVVDVETKGIPDINVDVSVPNKDGENVDVNIQTDAGFRGIGLGNDKITIEEFSDTNFNVGGKIGGTRTSVSVDNDYDKGCFGYLGDCKPHIGGTEATNGGEPNSAPKVSVNIDTPLPQLPGKGELRGIGSNVPEGSMVITTGSSVAPTLVVQTSNVDDNKQSVDEEAEEANVEANILPPYLMSNYIPPNYPPSLFNTESLLENANVEGGETTTKGGPMSMEEYCSDPVNIKEGPEVCKKPGETVGSECVDSWGCTEWSGCSSGATTQTRVCTYTGNCDPPKGSKPNEEEACPLCNPNWQCSDWTPELCVDQQTRTCTDTNNCGVKTSKPAESRGCPVVVGIGCSVGETECEPWSECITGMRTRQCTTTEECRPNAVIQNIKTEIQSCTPEPLETPSSEDAINNYIDYYLNTPGATKSEIEKLYNIMRNSDPTLPPTLDDYYNNVYRKNYIEENNRLPPDERLLGKPVEEQWEENERELEATNIVLNQAMKELEDLGCQTPNDSNRVRCTELQNQYDELAEEKEDLLDKRDLIRNEFPTPEESEEPDGTAPTETPSGEGCNFNGKHYNNYEVVRYTYNIRDNDNECDKYESEMCGRAICYQNKVLECSENQINKKITFDDKKWVCKKSPSFEIEGKFKGVVDGYIFVREVIEVKLGVQPNQVSIQKGNSVDINIEAKKEGEDIDFVAEVIEGANNIELDKVSGKGIDTIKITGKAEGDAKVKVSGGDLSEEVGVTVVEVGEPTLNLNKDTISLKIGGTDTITVTAKKADTLDDTISASSNNEDIAIVSVSGNVLTVNAVAVGGATITVTSGSNVVKTISVSVSELTCSDGTINNQCSTINRGKKCIGGSLNADTSCSTQCKTGEEVFDNANGCISICASKQCTLTEAKWVNSLTGDTLQNAFAGDTVNLTIIGSECECSGIFIDVWEDDITPDDDVSFDIEKSRRFFNGGNEVSIPWKVEYLQDDIFAGGPEYYFIAALNNQNTIKSDILNVDRTRSICSSRGGVSCLISKCQVTLGSIDISGGNVCCATSCSG